jgi:hypothetical protein
MEEITHNEQSDAYRQQIRKRIKRQHEFQKYLSVWFGVSLMLTIIWWLTPGPQYFWPVWPMFGMGIGAFFQWRAAYGTPPREITDADIDAEIDRIQKSK